MANTLQTDTWVIEPRGERVTARLGEFYRARGLLRYFAFQAVAKTYRRTYLGSLWLLIRPLFPLIIGLLIFQGLVGNLIPEVPYLIFYVSGLCIWQLFAQSLSWITRSLESNRRLLKKLYFPRLILPIAFIAPAAVEFAIQVGVLAMVAIYYRAATGIWYLTLMGTNILYVMGALALAVGLALGIGLWTSVMATEARDIRYFLGYVLGFWQYLTPVFYPSTAIPENVRWALHFNPIACASDLFRRGVLGIGTVNTTSVVIASAIVLVVLCSGLAFFLRYEKILADNV